jgi:hypothetical protein
MKAARMTYPYQGQFFMASPFSGFGRRLGRRRRFLLRPDDSGVHGELENHIVSRFPLGRRDNLHVGQLFAAFQIAGVIGDEVVGQRLAFDLKGPGVIAGFRQPDPLRKVAADFIHDSDDEILGGLEIVDQPDLPLEGLLPGLQLVQSGDDVLKLGFFRLGGLQELLFLIDGFFLEIEPARQPDDDQEKQKVADRGGFLAARSGGPAGRTSRTSLASGLRRLIRIMAYFSALRVESPTATPKMGAISLKKMGSNFFSS